MQKYILFICSIVLFSCSLSAQLKEKVVSLTKNLNQLKNSISKPSGPPSGLPTIDVGVQTQGINFIFRGWVDSPESLKDFLKEANYDVTIKQAQELYTAWKSKLEKRPLNKLLSDKKISEILKDIVSGLIKSPKDLQDSLKREEYIVTLEQAQKLYEELKIPTAPPPAPPAPPVKKPSTGSKTPATGTKVTINQALAAVEKAVNPVDPKDKIDFTTTAEIVKYLKSINMYPDENDPEIGAFRGQLRDFIKK